MNQLPEEINLTVSVPVAELKDLPTQAHVAGYCSYRLWLLAIDGGYIPQTNQLEGSWPFSVNFSLKPDPDPGDWDGVGELPVILFVNAATQFEARQINGGRVVDTLPSFDECRMNPYMVGEPHQLTFSVSDVIHNLATHAQVVSKDYPQVTMVMDAARSCIIQFQISEADAYSFLCFKLGIVTMQECYDSTDDSNENIDAVFAHLEERVAAFGAEMKRSLAEDGPAK